MTQFFFNVRDFEFLTLRQMINEIINAARRAGLDEADAITAANNHELFIEFSRHALAVVSSGRDHYSARTIIEVIRHNTLIADNDQTFKINNNIAPIFARVSMELFPALNGLFSIRKNNNVSS